MTKAMKVLALLFAGFLFLAACSDDNDGGEGTTTTEDSGSDDTSSDDTSSDDTSSDDTSSDDTSSDDTTPMADYEPENSEEDVAAVVDALTSMAGGGMPADDPYTVCFADQLINEYGSVDEAVDAINSLDELEEGDIGSLEDLGNLEELGMEWMNASLTCADVMLGDLGEELDEQLGDLDQQLEDAFGN